MEFVYNNNACEIVNIISLLFFSCIFLRNLRLSFCTVFFPECVVKYCYGALCSVLWVLCSISRKCYGFSLRIIVRFNGAILFVNIQYNYFSFELLFKILLWSSSTLLIFFSFNVYPPLLPSLPSTSPSTSLHFPPLLLSSLLSSSTPSCLLQPSPLSTLSLFSFIPASSLYPPLFPHILPFSTISSSSSSPPLSSLPFPPYSSAP